MATAPAVPVEPSSAVPLFTLSWDSHDWSLSMHASGTLLVGAALLVVAWLIYRSIGGGISLKTFELDQAEIGVGTGKFHFKPNLADKQIGYAIWVELSTRKIGLPIDFDHDVISEIYDSWHTYFSVRAVQRSIPLSREGESTAQQLGKLRKPTRVGGFRRGKISESMPGNLTTSRLPCGRSINFSPCSPKSPTRVEPKASFTSCPMFCCSRSSQWSPEAIPSVPSRPLSRCIAAG